MSFNFLLCPLEIQINILSHLAEEEFNHMKSMKELKFLFDYPHEQRIYEERSRNIFNSYLKFKENISWKEFYDRILVLKKNEPLNYAKECASDNKLMELKIITDENPNISNWVLPIDIACAEGNLEIIQWFISIGRFPNSFSINLIADEAHIECLDWLFENYRLLPNVDGANWVAESGHLNVLYWLEKRNVYPDNVGANLAAINGHINILNFLEEKNIFPTNLNNRYSMKVVDWFRSRNIHLMAED